MSFSEARLHLELAYHAVVGTAPPPKVLAMLLAQWALETGRGNNMWSYNFGGIKSSAGGASLETRESYGTQALQITQRFRAYRTAMEGAKDYIQTLAHDFPTAFHALHSGNAPDFVEALATSGYFTGNPAEYDRAIVRLATEFGRTL